MEDRQAARVSFPLLFASLTGRSGHGLARMHVNLRSIRSASERTVSTTGAARSE